MFVLNPDLNQDEFLGVVALWSTAGTLPHLRAHARDLLAAESLYVVRRLISALTRYPALVLLVVDNLVQECGLAPIAQAVFGLAMARWSALANAPSDRDDFEISLLELLLSNTRHL